MSRLLAWLDRLQRGHLALAFPFAVIKKFGEDRASRLAALIAYYAFFSLFPLLLAFVSILGFVLDNDPELREDILESVLVRIPVIGVQLLDSVQPLTGSPVALVIGLVGALWAGLGVTSAIAQAFSELWDIPRYRQPNMLKARARGLLTLIAVAIVFTVGTAAAGLAAAGEVSPAVVAAATFGGSLLVNALVYLTAFLLLTARSGPIRDLLPGVALGAIGTLALQSAGGWYVDRTVAGATDVYGAFALVIGLMSWFWLTAHLILIAAELNVVLSEHLWPRSLTGELTEADRRALESGAVAMRMDKRAQVDVTFDEPSE